MTASRLKTLAVLLAGAAPTLITTAPARAGTYEVKACDAAPGFASSAWEPEWTAETMTATRFCPSNTDDHGGLVARHIGQRMRHFNVPAGSAARWRFECAARDSDRRDPITRVI